MVSNFWKGNLVDISTYPSYRTWKNSKNIQIPNYDKTRYDYNKIAPLTRYAGVDPDTFNDEDGTVIWKNI